METFKYRGSELLCEASGPDFRTAMIHTTACGVRPTWGCPTGWDGLPRIGRRPATFGLVHLKICIPKPLSFGKLSR